ncbi:unnamed protein product [Aphanomyces euteiches]
MGNHIRLVGALALLGSTTIRAADTYDVIIIGSGPGGLVAAEYLSRNSSISVLVLEAGGPSLAATGGTDIPSYIRPESWTVFDIPGEYTSTAFGGNSQYRIDWVASPSPLYLGKVVGGSSSLNGMLYFRTPDSYVSSSGWPYDADTVNDNFAEIETMFSQTNIPSPDGQRYLQEAYNIIHDALLGRGFREVDINQARNSKSQSFGHPPFAIANGLRDSPAKTFYGNAKARSNFKLLTSSPASYIVQSRGVATGVVYSSNGQSVLVNLSQRGSVVVAAGAVSTPKVLMQSGVGPQSQLQLLVNQGNFPGVSKDASQRVVNENIGNGLFDTLEIMATFDNPKMSAFDHGSRPSWAINQYTTKGHSGPWASPDPILIGYETVNGNDFQVTGFCHGFNGGSTTNFGIAVYLNNPTSRTKCIFQSDGSYHFDLDSALYSNGGDTAALNAYFNQFQSYLQSGGSSFVQRTNIVGTNHYGGSCIPSNNANDASRCTDGSFKVVGTSNIFVADASLMRQGTVNPYGFTMQIGLQAGKNIQQFIANNPVVQSQCSAIQSDTDYSGNDIGSTSRPSADLCCADCAANPNCRLFVWYQNVCYLKSAIGTKTTLSGRQAGLLQTTTTSPPPPPPPSPTTPTPVSGCNAIEEDTDYVGNDIGQTQQSSADLCCADCTANANCQVFVWYQNVCYMKSSTAGGKVTLSGRRAGSRKSTSTTPTPVTTAPTSTCSAVESYTDFVGQDVRNVAATSPGNCCIACLAEPKCNAYSWTVSGICYMKQLRAGTNANAIVTSARVNKCNPIEVGVDYIGNDLTSVASAVIDDCCAYCRMTSGCRAFSYANGICYLKSAKGSTTANSGVSSATTSM